jgi:predicted NAD/FAD-dependent oxidoreductase
MYDVAIIGAGIAGLYCATELELNNLNVILFESDQVGGRIRTHKNPQYEIGAGRFNHSHKILWYLIKKYNLEKETIQIPHTKYYLDDKLYNVEKYINNCMTYIINFELNDNLRKITFYQHCIKVLGKKNAELLVNVYGYYSEFKVLNAYDAIILFRTSNTYYVMKNGLQSLTDKMSTELNIKYECVTKVERICDYFKVNNVYAKNVIFTIPTSLLTFPILKPIQEYIKIPVVMPLLRIYADYGIEFKYKITTSSFLKYIIPIKGTLVMISYTDGKNVDSYLNGKLKSERVIQKMIQKELHKLGFNVKEPTYFKCHYWPIGTHSWPININSEEISNKMINPLPNIYICGDGFSHKQGWMEGALETAKQVVKLF